MLHDVVEDTDATINEIEKLFGKKVASIVFECTEENSSDSWSVRKKAVLNRVSIISKDAGLVKSADVLHNLYEMVEQVKEYGPTFLQKFHASKKDKLTYEHKRLSMLKKYHPNRLLKDIENNIKTLEELLLIQ